MLKKRNRTKQTVSLKDRLSAWTSDVRAKAAQFPPGQEREALLKKARQPTPPPISMNGPTRPACSHQYKTRWTVLLLQSCSF
jgi:hypothetical protein